MPENKRVSSFALLLAALLDSTCYQWQETAALRDFSPLYVRFVPKGDLLGVKHVSITITPSIRRLDRHLADKPLSTGRLSEYPTDYFVGICIETSAVAEQNTLWLPRVDFSDCRLRLLPLKE